jgi:hypothetical protein
MTFLPYARKDTKLGLVAPLFHIVSIFRPERRRNRGSTHARDKRD